MREKVLDAMLAKQTLQQIAAWCKPEVSEATLSRWRMKIFHRKLATQSAVIDAIANKDQNKKQAVSTAVQRAVTIATLDPFTARLHQHQATIDKSLNTTEDPLAVAALISTDIRGLELNARLCGRLENAGSQTIINIVTPQAQPAEPAQPADCYGTIDIKASR